MNRGKNTDLVILCLLVGAIAIGVSLVQKPPQAQSTPSSSPPAANLATPGLSGTPKDSIGESSLMLRLPLKGSAVDEGPLHLECVPNAISFDDDHGGSAIFGRSSFIKVTHPERFNGMDKFTLTAWICPSQLSEHSNIISKVHPNRDFNLQMAHTGQVVAHIANPNYEFCVSKRQLKPNQWVHVAATYSPHTWKMYLDGQLDQTTTVDRGPGWSGDSLTIGNLMPDSSETFWGKLDEVRIYRGELSPAEIAVISKQ